MRVFDFTLLSGYEFSGVDVAQGFRARLFAKNNVNAKFIFTELPTIRDMELYGSQKIKRGQINRYILDNISYKLDAGLTLSDMQSAATVSDYLMLRVYQGLSRQRERIGDEEAYEQFVREATLKAVDDGWVELIDYLEQLKYAVAGRASAQRNVMFEYQNEAFESFLDTEKAVKCNIIRNILLSDVKIGKDGRLQVIYP